MEHLWNTAQQKGDVANNDAKGAKTAFFAHFVEHCAKCSTGNNPRKRLIFCFVGELGNERTAQQKGSLSLSSHRGTIGGIFDPRVLPGQARQDILSNG